MKKLLNFMTGVLSFLVIAFLILTIQDKLRPLRPTQPEMEFELKVQNEDVTLPENPIEYTGVVGEEGILPGNYQEFSPSITSTASEPGYALITITQPLLTEAEQATFQDGWEVDLPAPLYIITPNPGWELLESTIEGESIRTTYAYTEPINPGETIVLCDYVQMQGISIRTFAHLEDFQLGAKAYLFATYDLDGLNWQERWERIKLMIQ